MNKKFTTHEPKKLPVFPMEFKALVPNRVDRRVKQFAPLLSKAEKEQVKHMTNHQRVVFLKQVRES